MDKPDHLDIMPLYIDNGKVFTSLEYQYLQAASQNTVHLASHNWWLWFTEVANPLPGVALLGPTSCMCACQTL